IMLPTWSAAFITPTEDGALPEGPAAYLRKEFDVVRRPVRATLRVTAIGLIEPHVNGAAIGDEVLVPGRTSYRHRLVVSSHAITDSIYVGRNAIGAILGEGWALGRLGWENQRHHYSDRPAALLQLDLEFADGSIEVVASDRSFRSSTGGVRAHSIYDGEE